MARQQQPSLPSLDDVAREPPRGSEIDGWFERIDAMADREAVLAYGALIESTLEDALSHRMSITDKKRFDELFRKPNALLGSWSSKTVLAHNLAIFSDEVRSQMDCVRRLRNAFAHAIRPVDFSNPTLAAEARKLDCRKMLKTAEFTPRGTDDPRDLYFDVAEALIGHHLAFVEHIKNGVKDGTIPGEAPPFHSRYA